MALSRLGGRIWRVFPKGRGETLHQLTMNLEASLLPYICSSVKDGDRPLAGIARPSTRCPHIRCGQVAPTRRRRHWRPIMVDSNSKWPPGCCAHTLKILSFMTTTLPASVLESKRCPSACPDSHPRTTTAIPFLSDTETKAPPFRCFRRIGQLLPIRCKSVSSS
jgi:hypothetical protein